VPQRAPRLGRPLRLARFLSCQDTGAASGTRRVARVWRARVLRERRPRRCDQHACRYARASGAVGAALCGAGVLVSSRGCPPYRGIQSICRFMRAPSAADGAPWVNGVPAHCSGAVRDAVLGPPVAFCVRPARRAVCCGGTACPSSARAPDPLLCRCVWPACRFSRAPGASGGALCGAGMPAHCAGAGPVAVLGLPVALRGRRVRKAVRCGETACPRSAWAPDPPLCRYVWPGCRFSGAPGASGGALCGAGMPAHCAGAGPVAVLGLPVASRGRQARRAAQCGRGGCPRFRALRGRPPCRGGWPSFRGRRNMGRQPVDKKNAQRMVASGRASTSLLRT